jgi:hypothetical protein
MTPIDQNIPLPQRGRPRIRPQRATPIAGTLKALQQRLGLSNAQAAAYLGVPLVTWRNWVDGLRQPPAAVDRLIEVLGVVEALAPDVHAVLVRK